MKQINTKPQLMNEDKARLTARELNESEEKHSDPEDRLHFDVRHVGNFLFEVVCTDKDGIEVSRW